MRQGKRARVTRLGVFRRLMIINIIIGLIPTCLLSIMLVSQRRLSLDNELERSYEQNFERFATAVENRLLYYYRDIMGQLAINKTIQGALTCSLMDGNPYLNGKTLTEELGKYLTLDMQGGLIDCMIYSIVTEKPVYHNKVTMLSRYVWQPWYNAYAESQREYVYHRRHGESALTLSFIRPIVSTNFFTSYYGKQLGLIKLDVDPNELVSRQVSHGKDEPYVFAALTDEGDLLYLSDPKWGDAFERLPEITDGRIVAGRNAYLASAELDACGMRLYMLIPVDAAWEQIMSILTTTLLLCGLSVLAVALFSFVFTAHFAGRFQILLQKIARAESGDLTPGPPVKGNDELTIIDSQFDHMVMRLDHTIQTGYVAELEKKEAQLRALQLQINPHFLYNTLEAVSAIAGARHVPVVGELCSRLGDMLRYSLARRADELVTVRDEIHHVKNYVFIQKTRFSSRFEVYFNITEDLMDASMPFFILQPLVENAISHGLGARQGQGSVEVSAGEQAGALVLTVEDDGVGMTAAQLERLREHIESRQPETALSIGIRNVHQRVRLTYGEPYGVVIESTPGEGTTVSVHLPLQGRSIKPE